MNILELQVGKEYKLKSGSESFLEVLNRATFETDGEEVFYQINKKWHRMLGEFPLKDIRDLEFEEVLDTRNYKEEMLSVASKLIEEYENLKSKNERHYYLMAAGAKDSFAIIETHFDEKPENLRAVAIKIAEQLGAYIGVEEALLETGISGPDNKVMIEGMKSVHYAIRKEVFGK